MIDRISPFILEVLLGIALAFICYTLISEEKIILFITSNSNLLQKIYGAFLGLNITFAGYLLQEKDKEFIQFLRNENADKWYMKAVFFNLIMLSIGIVIIMFFSNIPNNANFLIYSILGINILQSCTSFTLWYNYIDVKRTFHSK